MNNILECRRVSKVYSNFPALNNLSLDIPRGKIVGLLGPNGSGKTTLIKLIAGLLTPTNGELLVDGKQPGTESKAIVSYLPERPYFNTWMRVREMIDYFADFYSDFDRDRATTMLMELSIDPDAKMKTLSKGTKEKVQLILVMARKAQLYLLDEPIGGVDPAARDYILKTILTNYDSEASIIISTHLIQDIEKILDEFVFINMGQIMMMGTADQVREEQGKSLDELFREVFKC